MLLTDYFSILTDITIWIACTSIGLNDLEWHLLCFTSFPWYSLSPSHLLLLTPVLPSHPVGRGLAVCGHPPLTEGTCGQETGLCCTVKLPLYKSLKYLIPMTLTWVSDNLLDHTPHRITSLMLIGSSRFFCRAWDPETRSPSLCFLSKLIKLMQ